MSSATPRIVQPASSIPIGRSRTRTRTGKGKNVSHERPDPDATPAWIVDGTPHVEVFR